MSTQSHNSNNGASVAHNTYLVILKVYGDAIQLWSQSMLSNQQDLKIFCHNVESQATSPKKSIQMFILDEATAYNDEDCKFRDQSEMGQTIRKSDLITFMTEPVDNTRKASYAIDINVSRKLNNSMDDDLNQSSGSEHCEKVGTAYVYLDPKFSSSGIQRSPLIGGNKLPIGQIQIEYLIVTNPVAYSLPGVRPNWLYTTQLDAGHRGAGSGRRSDLPGELLENTIASFNYAHRNGAHMCELDVLVSADGVPVVYHDFDVDAVAAQQSRDQLGKFRVQVNEFTVKQMRDFRLLSLHDKEGATTCTVNIPNQAENNKPFPTLEEVLNEVDETCGLNIEIKWPQLLESGKMEAREYREINDFVDRIIDVIERYVRNLRNKSNKTNSERPILLSTLNANVAIMLRLKQTQFPVLFLTTGDKTRFKDLFTKSIKNAIHFVQAFDMAGINPNAAYLTKDLVRYAQERGQLVYAWGKIETPQAITDLKRTGLNGVIYDKIDLIKPRKS